MMGRNAGCVTYRVGTYVKGGMRDRDWRFLNKWDKFPKKKNCLFFHNSKSVRFWAYMSARQPYHK